MAAEFAAWLTGHYSANNGAAQTECASSPQPDCSAGRLKTLLARPLKHLNGSGTSERAARTLCARGRPLGRTGVPVLLGKAQARPPGHPSSEL